MDENQPNQHDRDSSLSITPAPVAGHPATEDRAAGAPGGVHRIKSWRAEPEISPEQQTLLAERRAIAPEVRTSTYPFAGMSLTRADVEWLLATHENGRGPVQWDDVTQRGHIGLDVRGANLQGVNLRGLPLVRLLGGLAGATDEQIAAAAVHLERSDLREAQLQGADLRGAWLEGARVEHAHLELAQCVRAQMKQIDLRHAHLQGASLREAFMEKAESLCGAPGGRNAQRHAAQGGVAYRRLSGRRIDWRRAAGQKRLSAQHPPGRRTALWRAAGSRIADWGTSRRGDDAAGTPGGAPGSPAPH